MRLRTIAFMAKYRRLLAEIRVYLTKKHKGDKGEKLLFAILQTAS
jgi:hypothetical protein